MANELLVERKVYRIMANITNKLWHKIAWWTTANSVDAEDGRSLETKVGAINGITDSLTSTSSNIAASAKAVNTLNSNLIRLVTEERQLVGTITLSAGLAADYTVSINKDGYTPIGIVGYTIKNTAMMYCYRCYLDGTNCIFSIRNLQEVSDTFGFSVFVLYSKN